MDLWNLVELSKYVPSIHSTSSLTHKLHQHHLYVSRIIVDGRENRRDASDTAWEVDRLDEERFRRGLNVADGYTQMYRDERGLATLTREAGEVQMRRLDREKNGQ
jgi:hypothetical protein